MPLELPPHFHEYVRLDQLSHEIIDMRKHLRRQCDKDNFSKETLLNVRVHCRLLLDLMDEKDKINHSL